MNIELTREELEHNIRVLRSERDRLEAEVGRLQGREREEMRCKNEAYAFILESGLLDQFREYSRLKVCGDNPHQACLDWIDFEAKRRRSQRGTN
jgi:hypothetical protein